MLMRWSIRYVFDQLYFLIEYVSKKQGKLSHWNQSNYNLQLDKLELAHTTSN